MAFIEPCTITVPESQLARLSTKLSAAVEDSFPDELEHARWDYGAPLADIKRLTAYWRNEFDWKKQEAKLNELSNFRTTIPVDGFETINLHFLHQKSNVDGAIPLLFCHGWPGNYLEVTQLLSLLSSTSSSTPAFHIVAPSLPNYGWSSGTKKRGFGLAQYAETCHKLMLALGYTEYVTQGGDWGMIITRTMGLLYPSHVRASHINMIHGSAPTLASHPVLWLKHTLTPYSSCEKAGLARTNWFLKEGRGYAMLQGTKPQTLGYALSDSPVGLLAWIYEKLHDWSDDYPWTDDEILTWVSIYWFSTAGPAATLRIYYECIHATIPVERARVEKWIPHVKLGMAYFPKELTVVPKSWGRTYGPVVYESVNDRGGHFAATERPDVIAGDLQKMFGKGGGAYGVVKGKDGYGIVKARL